MSRAGLFRSIQRSCLLAVAAGTAIPMWTCLDDPAPSAFSHCQPLKQGPAWEMLAQVFVQARSVIDLGGPADVIDVANVYFHWNSTVILLLLGGGAVFPVMVECARALKPE
jgi:hypothetical protein